MSRTVYCVILKRDAEGLDEVPMPGELGQRIYDNVSREGWLQWLQRLQMIINENQLNTADPTNIAVIQQHMSGFLFGESELQGDLPVGFHRKEKT